MTSPALPVSKRGEPQLVWHKRRHCFYIRSIENGSPTLRSTGTTDTAEAIRKFNEFLADPSAYVAKRKARPSRGDRPPTKEDFAGFVYFIGCPNLRRVKIGFSKDVAGRLAGLQPHSPVILEILATREGTMWTEADYHNRFKSDRLHGEWFTWSDAIQAEIDKLQPSSPHAPSS